MKAPRLSTAPPLAATLRPDLSQWNGRIDAAAARQAGIVEAIIRFGEGYAADPLALLHWQHLADLGVVLSAYWAIHPTKDSNRQADYFLAMDFAARAFASPRRLWVDCQLAPSLNPRQPAVPIAVMLALIERERPFAAGVYTRSDWWHLHVGRSTAWAAKFPLWCADWNEARQYPRVPDPWKDEGAELWQIGSAPAAWAPKCDRVDCNIRLVDIQP